MYLDEPAETVGATVLARIARIPRAGDKVELAPGLHVEVTGISRRRIQKVRVRTPAATSVSVP